MADSLRILLGVATLKPDQRFLMSLAPFANDVARFLPYVEIDYVSGWVWNQTLPEAQNMLADRTLERNYDYLLTIEDDHWGFTWEMLLTCLEAKTHVAGIPYRSRHFPFPVVPMEYKHTNAEGIPQFKGMDNPEKHHGYCECDLLGFGFTLIKSDVFRIIDRPFFVENITKYPGCGPIATDILFGESLKAKGIKPIGCFQHRLNHRDIEESKYKQLLVEGILSKSSLFGTLNNVDKFHKMQDEFERNKKENIKLKENKNAGNNG